MTLTKKEEDILRKLIEVEKLKKAWDDLHTSFTNDYRAQEVPIRESMKARQDELVAKRKDLDLKAAELKALMLGG